MAVQKVLQLGDPVLREACKEVKDASAPEIRTLVEDLQDTLAFWRELPATDAASPRRKLES